MRELMIDPDSGARYAIRDSRGPRVTYGPSEPVSDPKFPASRDFTGNFIDSGLSGASTAQKKRTGSEPYEPIPYVPEQGIFCGLAGNLNWRSGKFPPDQGNPRGPEMVLSGLLVPVSPFSALDVRRRPPVSRPS